MDQELLFNRYKSLPKLELHAHLGGSLSANTLKLLGVSDTLLKGYEIKNLTVNSCEKLKEAFKLFKVAHDATKTREAIYLATTKVIEEFAEDNVMYLELRTTPREEENMTKRQYIETIINAIRANENSIIVKLILSIDRRHSLQVSNETLNLILEMRQAYPDIIKGIDLCGDPFKGSFTKELFERARDAGLKVTLHCAEIKNDDEVMEILKFKPDRIGHATFIHPSYGGSNDVWEFYRSNPIPIECCITSNILCETARSFEEHHIREWIELDLPFTINTDDKGVFNTTCSEEYFAVAQKLNVSKDYLYNITLKAVDYSFASNDEKQCLAKALLDWKSQN